MMAPPENAETPMFVELYIRSLAPRHGQERIRRVIDRLEAAEREGLVQDIEVHLTGEAVPISPEASVTDYGAGLSRRIAQFEAWAQQTGRHLGDTFDRRQLFSTITGRVHDAVIPSTLVLAEVRDGRVSFVSPCREAGMEVTIEDRLAVLEEAGRVDDSVRGPSARPAPSLQ